MKYLFDARLDMFSSCVIWGHQMIALLYHIIVKIFQSYVKVAQLTF